MDYNAYSFRSTCVMCASSNSFFPQKLQVKKTPLNFVGCSCKREGSEGENIPNGQTIDGRAAEHTGDGEVIKAEEKKEEAELQFEDGQENGGAAE